VFDRLLLDAILAYLSMGFRRTMIEMTRELDDPAP
jgi:hypothetical protein